MLAAALPRQSCTPQSTSWQTAARSFVWHYTANEFNYDTPDWLGDTTVVITASLGGSTPETVKANSVAKAAGATVVSVTHAAGSALTKEADYTIVHGFEANYAAKLEKMGYVLALAVEILQQVEGFDKYDKMIEGLTNVFEAAENAANSARKSAKEFAEKYKDAPVVYVMSSGASMEVAYSTSICLMMEMQWVNSGSFHSGEFFHGPFEIVDKDVPFILLMNDGKTRPVDARALTFLHRFDALTTVVDAKDYGLGNAVDSSVITYFNPLMHPAVFRVSGGGAAPPSPPLPPPRPSIWGGVLSGHPGPDPPFVGGWPPPLFVGEGERSGGCSFCFFVGVGADAVRLPPQQPP